MNFVSSEEIAENTSYSLYAQTLNFCFSEKVADSKAPKCKTLEGQNRLEQFIHRHKIDQLLKILLHDSKKDL